jgi:hypothetical protein
MRMILPTTNNPVDIPRIIEGAETTLIGEEIGSRLHNRKKGKNLMLTPWWRRKEAPAAEQEQSIASETTENAFEEEDEGEEEEYEYEEELEAIQERVYAWGEEWSKTAAFEALSQEQKDEAEYIVESFTEYIYNYHDVAPEEWNVADMEDCCLNTLPRKISAQETYFRSLASVLASFFRFLGDTGRLRNASKMADRVRAIDRKIVQVSQDPRNWGIAKSLVMAAMAEGVDLTNQAEMNAFIMRYNAQMLGSRAMPPSLALPELPLPSEDMEEQNIEPYTRTSPKVGRNDPCPCGSGKKYKKCCGSVS